MIQKQKSENEIIYAFLTEQMDKASKIVGASLNCDVSAKTPKLRKYFAKIESFHAKLYLNLSAMRDNIEKKIPEFSFF